MSERQPHNWPVSIRPKHALADPVQTQGTYAATDRGELREDQAIAIGFQILRENSLKLLPTLRRQSWRKAE